MNCRVALVFLLCTLNITLHAQDRVIVAAASDLKFALDSVIEVFSLHHPTKVDVTYGSSGKLSEQIRNGAPFDLFFSADLSYPEALKKEGKLASDIYPYAKGRIVVWSKKVDPNKTQMQSLLMSNIRKLAIANPQHAPYGKRAVESLEYYKLHQRLKPKLVYGENISQTAQFVSSGAADIGIIALSLALSPNMKGHGKYFLIPEESHSPLIQGAVITSHGKNNTTASKLFLFLKSQKAIDILDHYGFKRP